MTGLCFLGLCLQGLRFRVLENADFENADLANKDRENTTWYKHKKTGEEICDGPDTQLRPTLMSLKVNHYCQVALTVLIKANAILKCLNDL